MNHGKNRLALLTASAAFTLATSPAYAQQQGTDTPPADDGGDIVVTGSLIPQASIPSPLDIVGAGEIAARGIASPGELVRVLPANSGSEAQVDQLNQPLTSGTAQFNLRNLGLGSTLVLLNGRRQTLSAVAATDGSTFVDVNSLVPLIAIQRVEVVKDGAAATYGSDAVAGVVNFITRKRIERPEINARLLTMDGAKQLTVQGIAGFDLAGGNLVLAASYYSSTRLGTDERSFSRARTFGRPSWHSVSSYGQPGSYFLPSLRQYRPDPDCTNPAFPDSYLNSPADSFCRYDFSDYFDLIPTERRAQVFAAYNADLGDDIKLNLEAGYANTWSKVRASPSFPIITATPLVPAAHPDNPFGQDVFFRGRLLGSAYGPSISTFAYDTFRLAGGLEGRFGFGWNWSVNASYSQQKVRYHKPDTKATAFQNALKGLGGDGCDPATGTPGAGPCHYFNPFGSSLLGGTHNSDALVASLIGDTDLRGRASRFTAEALSSGTLFSWWGGDVAAAIGGQYRRDTFRHDWSDDVNRGELITIGQAPDFSGSQESLSLYGEVKIPFARLVELTLSGRYEKYLNSFSNFSPKVALLFRPSEWLSLRGSWGRAFRAPSVYQTSAVQSGQPSVSDGGTFIFVNTQTFGNPNLKPEKSKSYNAGATLRPLKGLEFNVDFYGFTYSNLIVKENPQSIIDQERADTMAGLVGTPAQQRVTRDPFGNLQRVRLDFINASSVKTEGIDVSARYRFGTGFGDFDATAAWTHLRNYRIRVAPGAPAIDGVGSVNFNNLGRSLPRDRLEFGLGWSLDDHRLQLQGHYVSGYKNDRNAITDRSINAWTTFDLQYALTLDKLAGLGGTTLSIGAINIFDRDPPVAQLNLGFDPIVHDPRGRVIYIGINQSF